MTSQQRTTVSRRREGGGGGGEGICADTYTCCHTDTEVAGQTCNLTRSQYTHTGPIIPNANPVPLGAWQRSHWSTARHTRRSSTVMERTGWPQTSVMITQPEGMAGQFLCTEAFKFSHGVTQGFDPTPALFFKCTTSPATERSVRVIWWARFSLLLHRRQQAGRAAPSATFCSTLHTLMTVHP